MGRKAKQLLQKGFHGGRDRTRTCDLLRVKKPSNIQWIHHLLGFS
jgi:hypothetical protein